MIYYYTLFTIFSIIATMVVIDQNVGEYIVLLSKLVKSQTERLYWIIRFHPAMFSSPIGRWWMMRKYMKEAKKFLMNENEDINN